MAEGIQQKHEYDYSIDHQQRAEEQRSKVVKQKENENEQLKKQISELEERLGQKMIKNKPKDLRNREKATHCEGSLLIRKLLELEETSSERLHQLTKEVKVLQDKNMAYENRIHDLEETLHSKENENKTLKETISKYSEENTGLKQKIEQCIGSDADDGEIFVGKIVRELATEVTALQEKLTEYENQTRALEENLDRKESESKTLKETISKYSNEITGLKQKISEAEDEKLFLSKWLSKLAEVNLTYNKPKLADFSDEIRPTALAEEFSELYDNEWTDTFEILPIKDERGKTQMLLEIVKRARQLCHDTIQDHVHALRIVKNAFVQLNIRNEMEEVVDESLRQAGAKVVQSFCHKTLTAQYENLTEQIKSVSDIRKYFECELSEFFQQDSAKIIAQYLSEDVQDDRYAREYIRKCLRICWRMCWHEPPVFIHFIEPRQDTPLDINVYKPYTKTGKYVDYVIWPPLYLHEGGPMLSKGVAQGRK